MIANYPNTFSVNTNLSSILETFWGLVKQFDKHDIDEYYISVSLKDLSRKTHSYRFSKEIEDTDLVLDTNRVTDIFSIGSEHGLEQVHFEVFFVKQTLQDIKVKEDFFGKAE